MVVKKMIILFVILLIGAGLIFVGCQATRSGYESAPYQVVRTDGKFELRDYPALTVVETPMARGGNEADGSFMRLFRFITGGERGEAEDRDDDAGVHVRQRLESHDGVRAAGETQRGHRAQAGRWRGDGAGVAGRPVRGAALQRRAQREAGGGNARALENLAGGARLENIVVAGVWLF